MIFGFKNKEISYKIGWKQRKRTAHFQTRKRRVRHCLVEKYPEKRLLIYDDFLQVENWYLNHAIDKNISNILNKAQEFRTFIERLLFTEEKVQFKIKVQYGYKCSG